MNCLSSLCVLWYAFVNTPITTAAVLSFLTRLSNAVIPASRLKNPYIKSAAFCRRQSADKKICPNDNAYLSAEWFLLSSDAPKRFAAFK
jgi:hypothetical protein